MSAKRRVRERPLDARLDAAANLEEALPRPLAGQELVVGRVDVAREQRRRVGVGARDEHGRHAQHVRGQTRGLQRADELRGRHEHLAAEVAALLLGRELILEVDSRCAGFDHPLHQLERVEVAAEAGLGVGDDRDEPVARDVALGLLDLVGAHQRPVQAAHERRHAVRRVERLVGIRVTGEVRVARDLPAGDVDPLRAGLDHLHGLRAGERAERRQVVLGVEELPEALGAAPGQRVLDLDRAAQPLDLVGRPVPADAVPPRVLAVAVAAHALPFSRCTRRPGASGTRRSRRSAPPARRSLVPLQTVRPRASPRR